MSNDKAIGDIIPVTRDEGLFSQNEELAKRMESTQI